MAQQDDPEVAAWLLSQPEGTVARWRPRAVEFGTQEQLLAGVYDRLGQALALLGDLPAGVKRRSKPPAAFPRPQTGIDKARALADAQLENELDQLVTAAHQEWLAEQQQKAGDGGDGTVE